MIKQLVLPLAGVAAFIILVGLLVKNSGNIVIPGFPTPAPTSSSLAKEQIKIGDKIIQVEIADNEASRELGLGGRTFLDQNSGMLFVFGSKKIDTFWMKGMLIPLDMIWISSNKVVKIDKNVPVPEPGTTDDNLKRYSFNQPVDYVLEVNSGFSDRNGISVGSMFEFLKNLQ